LNLRRFLQLYAVAGIIVLAIFWAFYSQRLLRQLEDATLFRSRLYAKYISTLSPSQTNVSLEDIIFEEVFDKIDFPVVISNTKGNPPSLRNVPNKDTVGNNLSAVIEKLDKEHRPIPIKAIIPVIDTITGDTIGVDTNTLSILHYGSPKSWKMLQYFPLIQISFIVFFVILGFVFIFASAKRAQDRLWVVLAREAAHQLGTPVSSLMGWSELIRPKISKEAADEIHADLERIKGILNRFARIGDKPRLEPHPIKPVIEATLEFMKHRAPSRIEFTYSIPENIQLLMDPTLISWTLENLIRNGIDAIGRKKGSIHIEGHPLAKGKHFELTVTDSGAGIDAKHARDIFRTGFTTKKHGWGIGLALSKRVIEHFHKGKLKMKSSKPGKTVLSIILPLWHE